jgi:peptide-O-fucosyltransferase
MGRIGNQAEHFLGSMAFAKEINRTLVVPPFRTYKNIPYKEWFKLEKLAEYHRIISAEDFMEHIAPKHWPAEERFAFCWMGDKQTKCGMKEGNPFYNFWDELGVDGFVKDIRIDFGYQSYPRWKSTFPPSLYPVIALKGAPASFPMHSSHRHYQKYMEWSDTITDEVNHYINKTFQNEKFVGIHLRNGDDWKNACRASHSMPYYMASPQCLDGTEKMVTINLCFPNKETILKDLEYALITNLNKTVRHIYVATDKNPMIKEIKEHFKDQIPDLNIVHYDPHPIIDWAILSRSDFFIGNCISSFTSFVKRERDYNQKLPSMFWEFRNL